MIVVWWGGGAADNMGENTLTVLNSYLNQDPAEQQNNCGAMADQSTYFINARAKDEVSFLVPLQCKNGPFVLT